MKCKRCHGTGSRTSTDNWTVNNCPDCGGSGEVRDGTERLLALESFRVLSIQVDRMLSQMSDVLDRAGEPADAPGFPGRQLPDTPRSVAKDLRRRNADLTQWAVDEQSQADHPAAIGCCDGEERLI